jgi:hypothetical protein
MSAETERRRDAARPASNRLFLKISGRRLRAYSIVKHVGRRSGREYVNPVSAYPSRNGFWPPQSPTVSRASRGAQDGAGSEAIPPRGAGAGSDLGGVAEGIQTAG